MSRNGRVASLPGDRRVVFGFTGWSEPTQPHGCGRALIIPRDITLGADGASPRINPIPELQSLRVAGSEVRAAASAAASALSHRSCEGAGDTGVR